MSKEEDNKISSWIKNKVEEFETGETLEPMEKVLEKASRLKKVGKLTPDSDYLTMAAYLVGDDFRRKPEEYWAVHKWAESKRQDFLKAMEKEDELSGRKEVVRGVVLDTVEEVTKSDHIEHLKFVRGGCDMTESHKTRLDGWIADKEKEPQKVPEKRMTFEEWNIVNLQEMEPSTDKERAMKEHLLTYYKRVYADLKAGRDPLAAEERELFKDEDKPRIESSKFLNKFRGEKNKEKDRER